MGVKTHCKHCNFTFPSKSEHKRHYEFVHKNNERKRKSSFNWKNELRNSVLKRDKNQCSRCGSKQKLHVHHKVRRSEGGTDELENLITLCDICHMEEHRNEMVYNIMIKSFWIYEQV